jgi:sugar lactone lactonase YvrE
MIKLKKANYFKLVAIILVILFFYQSGSLLCVERNMLEQFKIAKDEFKREKFGTVKKRLERLIDALDTKNIEERKLLAKSYLLLGAACEKTKEIKRAITSYQKACKTWKKSTNIKSKKGIIEKTKSVPAIKGVPFNDLKHYRKHVIENCGKKKFPWLLVVGGVVVVGVLVYLLIIKKPKYELTVTKGEGVNGSPGTGSNSYKKGKTVNYNYTLQTGYSDLTVTIDGQAAPASGTITMNSDRTLIASTTKLVSIHLDSEPTGAKIYMDDMEQGTTPADLLTTPGSHTIRVVKENWGEAQKTTTFKEDLEYTITASLSGYTYEFVTKWGSEGNNDGQFYSPAGLAIDTNGYIYVSDSHNHRVQKFDANGSYINQWGSQGSANGKFGFPAGIAIDTNGYIYVSDGLSNNRVQKFDTNGGFISKWGSSGSGNGQFDGPSGITVDSNGDIYIVDTWNYRIQKLDSNGNFITKWGSEGTGNGQFNRPDGIAIDSNGLIYIADTYNDRIQKFRMTDQTDSDGVWEITPSQTLNKKSPKSKYISPYKSKKEHSKRKNIGDKK